MYLSMKRSKDALLALGFFVMMALVVFSTLLCVLTPTTPISSTLTTAFGHSPIRYFAERGTWDQALETFVDADGDPSQFSSIPAAGWYVVSYPAHLYTITVPNVLMSI